MTELPGAGVVGDEGQSAIHRCGGQVLCHTLPDEERFSRFVVATFTQAGFQRLGVEINE
ncbi:MAG: hypothetical protein WCQ50_18170 [Spirochaetota bacterium]